MYNLIFFIMKKLVFLMFLSALLINCSSESMGIEEINTESNINDDSSLFARSPLENGALNALSIVNEPCNGINNGANGFNYSVYIGAGSCTSTFPRNVEFYISKNNVIIEVGQVTIPANANTSSFAPVLRNLQDGPNNESAVVGQATIHIASVTNAITGEIIPEGNPCNWNTTTPTFSNCTIGYTPDPKWIKVIKPKSPSLEEEGEE
jgi:hypothetical protein